MKIQDFEQNTLALDNFEGPLAFLVYLVQKSEIDLAEISLFEITEQYLTYLTENQKHNLDSGADFIDYTSLLLRIKSKKLLPGEPLDDIALEELEAPLSILPQLLEYCRFKKVAKELMLREEGQEYSLPKGWTPPPEEFPAPLGIERVALEELQKHFEEILRKAPEKKLIKEERWLIADKISLIREKLEVDQPFHFYDILTSEPCKDEVIVTFLSLLELMKLGELQFTVEDSHLSFSKPIGDTEN